MSANGNQESAKTRPNESDQLNLVSDAEAPPPPKPSRLRRPQFSLVPKPAKDSNEELVKLKQTIEKLEAENSELKDLRQEDQVKYEQILIYTDNLREEKSLLQAKVEVAEAQQSCLLASITSQQAALAKQQATLNKLNHDKNGLELVNSELQKALQESKLHAANQGKLVATHMELIAFSNGEISELQQKCDQQLQDMNMLRQKMSDLKVQLKEANRKTRSYDQMICECEEEATKIQEKVQSLQAQLHDSSQEVSNRGQQIKALQEANTRLQEQLQAKQAELNHKSSEMGHKLELGGHAIENLTEECNQLRSQLKSKESGFRAERQRMNANISGLLEEKRQLEEKAGNLTELTKELRSDLQTKTTSFQAEKAGLKQLLEAKILAINLSTDQNAFLTRQIEDLRSACASLQADAVHLEEANTGLKEQLRAKEAEFNLKSSEMSHKVEQGRRSNEELTKAYEQLCSELESKESSFLTEKERLDATISGLVEHNRNLQEKACNLNELTKELRLELKSKESCFQNEKERLVEHNRNLQEKTCKLNELTKELRTELQTKESSFLNEIERMSSTISSLLDDKRNLEEKTCSLTEIVTKMETELSFKINGSHSSLETSASTSASTSSKIPATGSGNQDRHAASSGVKQSAFHDNAKRRDRRMTAHDERRMASYWNSSRDIGTITDPDPESLSEKLLESQQKLLESEQKLLEEQQKLHEEQQRGKKLRQKIRELTAMFGNPSD